MLTRIVERAARLWATPEKPLRADPDVLAVVSYGVVKGGLSKGNLAVTERAAELAHAFPKAAVVFGSVSYAVRDGIPNTSEAECTLRMKVLVSAEVRNPIVYGGTALTTIHEAELFRDALDARKISPRLIVVVCEEVHSRTVRLVWRKLFPSAEIVLRLIPISGMVQLDQRMILARRPTVWLAANVLRHAMLVVFGMSVVRRFIQPASDAPR